MRTCAHTLTASLPRRGMSTGLPNAAGGDKPVVGRSTPPSRSAVLPCDSGTPPTRTQTRASASCSLRAARLCALLNRPSHALPLSDGSQRSCPLIGWPRLWDRTCPRPQGTRYLAGALSSSVDERIPKQTAPSEPLGTALALQTAGEAGTKDKALP